MAQFKKLKLPAPVDAEYSIPATQSDVRTDAASVQEILPTLITRLKDAGVTTLIMADEPLGRRSRVQGDGAAGVVSRRSS